MFSYPICSDDSFNYYKLNNCYFYDYDLVAIKKFFKDKFKNNNRIHFLINDYNLGFASGNNVGYRFARNELNADFIAVSNNDIIIKTKCFSDCVRKSFSRNRLDYIYAAREIEKRCERYYPSLSEKAHLWVYLHVLTTIRSVIGANQKQQFEDFLKEEMQYLKDNKHLLKKISFRRRLDYLGIVYFNPYIKLLYRLKG